MTLGRKREGGSGLIFVIWPRMKLASPNLDVILYKKTIGFGRVGPTSLSEITESNPLVVSVF